MSETCGLSMTTPVTLSVFDMMRGMTSTPTLTDFAVRNGAELNFGSSAIARLSAPSEPLKSDRLRLPTSTLRPRAAEACCSISGRKRIDRDQERRDDHDQNQNNDDDADNFYVCGSWGPPNEVGIEKASPLSGRS